MINVYFKSLCFKVCYKRINYSKINKKTVRPKQLDYNYSETPTEICLLCTYVQQIDNSLNYYIERFRVLHSCPDNS